MSANPTTLASTATANTPAQAGEKRTPFVRRLVLILLLLATVFASTYALAWGRANTLATRFLADADASYAAGNYIEAMTGYEEFDQARNTYVTRGGYASVARIWADSRAWPQPAGVERAQVRINEILEQRLTIEAAEEFIQANTGRSNPYLGIVYLRLGELYEAEGDSDDAATIYEEVVELFPNDAELVARAQANLARLNQ